MQGIGGLLVLFGLGGILLNQFGYDFTLVSWTNNWGYGTGIAIKLGVAALGAVLWFVGLKQEQG